MNKLNTSRKRDEVLFEFHRTCERPTEAQVNEWTKRYPELADDIRAHAEVRLEWADEADCTVLEPDDVMLSRGRSRAFNAIYNARHQSTDDEASPASWRGMLASTGFTIPQLAKHINIDRMVLAELSAGRMNLPIGKRLVYALTGALGVTQDAVEQAVTQNLAAPRLGNAKADRQPSIRVRSYEEVILASSMTNEQKLYWLDKG